MVRSRWLLISMLLVLAILALLFVLRAPAWVLLMLGSIVLALLYIVARLHSRFDPFDPRFGSCIPPISRPRDRP
jgi:hypothetical protein